MIFKIHPLQKYFSNRLQKDIEFYACRIGLKSYARSSIYRGLTSKSIHIFLSIRVKDVYFCLSTLDIGLH